MVVSTLNVIFAALVVASLERVSAIHCYECSEERENWKCNENEPVFCDKGKVCKTEESGVVTKGCGNKCAVSRGDAAEYSTSCKHCDEDLCNEPQFGGSKVQAKSPSIQPRQHAARFLEGPNYVLFAEPATFWGARLRCAEFDGILATIHDRNIQSFMNENFITDSNVAAITEEFPPRTNLSPLLDPVGAWIGLFRSHAADNTSAAWFWTDDGRILSGGKNQCKDNDVPRFQNWDGSEPSGSSQACGFISRQHGGKWKSGSCGRSLPAYICKFQTDMMTQSILQNGISYTFKAAATSSRENSLNCTGQEKMALDKNIAKSFMYVIERMTSNCGEITAKQIEKTPEECNSERKFVICQRPLESDCTTETPVSYSRNLGTTVRGCSKYLKHVDGHVLNFPSTRQQRFGYSLEKCDDGRPQAAMLCEGFPRSHFTNLVHFSCEKDITDLLLQVTNKSRSPTMQVKEMIRGLHAVTLFDDLSLINFSNVSQILMNLSSRASQVPRDALYNSVAVVSGLRHILDKWIGINRTSISLSRDDLTSLVESLEKFAEHVALSPNETRHRFSAEGVDVEVVELDDSIIYSGKDLKYENPDRSSLIRIIPNIPLSRSLSSQKLRAIFTTYDSADLFPTDEQNVKIESVISATVTDGEQTFSVPVQFSMRVDKISNVSADKCIKRECRYYNHSESKWRRDGCRKESESKEGYSDTVTCECDHTTSFGVVISQHAKPSYALDVISTIALSLCIICLFLTIVVFLATPELQRVRSAFTHKNLCACLALAYLTFLVGVEATSNRYACLVVAALIHFFLLSSWGWMAVESITMYRMFVRTFERRFIPESTKAAFVVYATAAVIVLATLSFSVLAHFQGWGNEIGCEDDGWSLYISEGYCWLQGRSLYFGFLFIVGLALIFNIILSGVIIKAITWGRKAVKCSREEQPLIHVMRAVLVAMLLGVAWIIAVPLAVIDNPAVQEVFGYLFAITIFAQGAFIFFFFCIRRKDVRASWIGALENLFNRGGANREETHGQSTSRNLGASLRPTGKVRRTPTSSTASEMTRKTVVSRASSFVPSRKEEALTSTVDPPTRTKEQHEMQAIEHSLDLVEFTGEEVFEN